VIHRRVFGSVRSQIEDEARRADLPFRYVRFPRHVLRDVKTWRGFDASGFGHIFHQWWNTPGREYLKAGFPALGLADQIQFCRVAELDEVALHHPTFKREPGSL